MAGDWYSRADQAEFEDEIARLGLQARVALLGPVTGVAKDAALASADVFLLPPRHHEGLPYAILEAMRAGLPVVTTASGFIPQVVGDGHCGFVVPRCDVNGLAEALARLAADRGLREAMGHNARRRFLAEYSLDVWAHRMMDAFDEAAASPRPGRHSGSRAGGQRP